MKGKKNNLFNKKQYGKDFNKPKVLALPQDKENTI